MKKNISKTPTVISLGGSLLAADGVTAFLSAFKKIIVSRVKKGDRFVIIVGGGEVCRDFQARARALKAARERDLDWIGIYATRLNASLIKAVFNGYTTDDLSSGDLKNVLKKVPVAVLGGLEPGGSSDFAAVRHAAACGAKRVLNLSNVSYVYDKDPRKFKDAVAHKKLTWKEYLKIIGVKRVPGGNYPFDPVASAFAKKHGMQVCMIHGKELAQVKKALEGRSFEGTIIE